MIGNPLPSRIALLLFVTWMSCPLFAAEPDALTGRRAVADFLKLPEGWSLGACSAVAVNSRSEIFVYHRGSHPILVFDAQGKYLRSWGDDLIGSAHGLRIDGNDDVWVTDIGNHRVFKFDAQGKLLLALGTGKPGDARDEFNKPTDLAFGPKGEIYVTDGYGNSRVLVFLPSGALLNSWGKPGRAAGEFRIPHAIVIDRQGRLLVGDRENDRIQIFNTDGKLLETWNGFAPYGLAFDGDGNLFVADGRAHQVLQLSATGEVAARFGREGTAVGEFGLPHMLAIDKEGNLFVAEVGGKRVQKLLRK
jgi:DNA-binding beta-propeller fold protein YncE